MVRIVFLFVFGSLALRGLSSVVSFRAPEIIPPVQSLTYAADVEVRLDAAQTVSVSCGETDAADWIRNHLKLWFRFEPKVVTVSCDFATWTLGDEGYRLSAKPDGVLVEAKTLQGVRYALFTLRQIAERDSSGATVAYYRLPQLAIEDSPALRFRGIHFCWFPEQSVDLVEREIRLAAFYKYNVVVLEPWGVFRSERHPWFGWPNAPMTKDVVRRLVATAKDLGVTLVPQFNIFGHASASRSCTGKHAALDVHPERESLFEPGGGLRGAMSSAWNWCLSNPSAVQVVKDIVVEMHEAFGNPPYFHIGCDEAEEPSCANCRAAPYARLVANHILGIGKLLKGHGARTMIWHDMLLDRGDSRWAKPEGATQRIRANGTKETAAILQLLPKDIVICDWYYGCGLAKYPTLEYFTESGFDTLTCPFKDSMGIQKQGFYAREHGLFGLLQTTWTIIGGEDFPRLLQTAAEVAWGGDILVNKGHFASVWRRVGWDMGTASYRDAGWYDTQVSRDIQGR